MWQVVSINNSFLDPGRLQALGDIRQQQLHDTFVAAVIDNATKECRYDAEQQVVRSPYVVLNVLARVLGPT